MTGRGLNLSGSALSNLMAVLQSRHLNCLILDNAKYSLQAIVRSSIGEEEIQMAAALLQEMRVCKLSLNDNHIGDKGLSLLLNSISDSCDMEPAPPCQQWNHGAVHSLCNAFHPSCFPPSLMIRRPPFAAHHESPRNAHLGRSAARPGIGQKLQRLFDSHHGRVLISRSFHLVMPMIP